MMALSLYGASSAPAWIFQPFLELQSLDWGAFPEGVLGAVEKRSTLCSRTDGLRLGFSLPHNAESQASFAFRHDHEDCQYPLANATVAS